MLGMQIGQLATNREPQEETLPNPNVEAPRKWWIFRKCKAISKMVDFQWFSVVVFPQNTQFSNVLKAIRGHLGRNGSICTCRSPGCTRTYPIRGILILPSSCKKKPGLTRTLSILSQFTKSMHRVRKAFPTGAMSFWHMIIPGSYGASFDPSVL